MRKRLGLCLACALLSALGLCSAHGEALSVVDELLATALKAPIGHPLLPDLTKADKELAAEASRRPHPPKHVDLDIELRAALIGKLRVAWAHTENNNLTDSIRAYTQALDLVRGLWDAAQLQQAENTPALDQLVTVVYERLAGTASVQYRANFSLSGSNSNTLLYRVINYGKDGDISAFELLGDSKTRRATWQEIQFSKAPRDLLDELRSTFEELKDRHGNASSKQYPFLFIISGDAASLSFEAERKIARVATSFLPEGVLTLIDAPDSLDRPITLVPSIIATRRIEETRGIEVQMIHRDFGVVLSRWHLKALDNLDHASELAKELAIEVATDFGIDVRASRSGPLQISSFAPAPSPSSRMKQASTVAATVDSLLEAAVVEF